MVWAGLCNGQRTRVHFIYGILNAQRYRDEIPEAHCCAIHHDHHLMLQHDNARPHVARICTQFLGSWKDPSSCMAHHTHRTCHPLSMFGMLWIGVYDSVLEFLTISIATSHSHWRVDQHSSDRNQQPDQLYVKEMCALHEANGGHTRYWLVFGPPPNTVKLHILEWPFIVTSLRHTCAIIMPSNQHLDTPHLWGGWIILCSLTQMWNKSATYNEWRDL